jgi:hypothetical protein
VTMLFLLLASHAVVDYSLQTEWIAKNKNRHAGGAPSGYDPRLHGSLQRVWPYVLSAHALEHGLGVYLATGGRIDLALAETAAHWMIDLAKCERWFGIHSDQALHVACKVLWCWLAGGFAA